MKFAKLSLLVFCMSICTIFLNFQPVHSSENIVRAKIGILVDSNNSVKMARASDRLRSGDLVRIYVHTEKASYIYVIYSDKKEVTLLNVVEQKMRGATLVLPSVSEYYEIDGSSSLEMFTIICSPVVLEEIPLLIDTDNSYKKWIALEKSLKGKSKIALTKKSETPFSIAGNVRSVTKSKGNEAIVQKLKIYSGNNFIVKKYEFKVKK
ncbi:MAG: DUF4384 domain-containing protein [Desulfobacteraceae bacterium]|nr:DUF4384 domain-containing protein [Desulfobacteraceae bacterium]